MIGLSPSEACAFAINAFGAMQKHEEIQELVTRVAAIEPKIILEIGIGKGGTSWLWSKFKSVEKIISIDLPGGPWGGGPSEQALTYIAQNSNCPIEFILGDSQDAQCLDLVLSKLGGSSVDFLFIDGDHSYAGVKADYDRYSPLVRSGGLVAFHDICTHPPEANCHVDTLWEEMINNPEAHGICTAILSQPLGWGGIGVVEKR